MIDSAGIRLSAVVMTHPDRRSAAEQLQKSHPELNFDIVVDPHPTREPSALRAARVAWAAADPAATHHLIVQDDMQLASGFADAVTRAVSSFPHEMLSLFTEWGARTSHAMRLACFEEASWVPVIDRYVPTNAYVLPAAVARAAATATGGLSDDVPDDVALLTFLDQEGLTAYSCVPTIADHEPVASLIGNDVIMGPRRSAVPPAGDRPVALTSTASRQTLVPHLLMWQGFGVCHVRDSAASREWREIPIQKYLAGLGLTSSDLLRRFADAVAAVESAGPPESRLRSRMSEPLLLQVWLVAFGYGLAAAGLLDGDLDRLERRLRAPQTQAALATLGPGALKRFVPHAILPELPQLLAPLIEQAIRAGAAFAAGAGPSERR